MYSSPKPYPYIPAGRKILYVPMDTIHMMQARDMVTQSGCAKHPVGAVLVRDGVVIGQGANGSMKALSRHVVCERVVHGCKTGEGYELCPNCVTSGHAEAMALADARQAGNDPARASLYLFGHWWCCEPCWDKIIAAHVSDVYLVEQATELFDRPNGTVDILKTLGVVL